MSRIGRRAVAITLGIFVIQIPLIVSTMAAPSMSVLVDIRPGDSAPTELNIRGTDMSMRDGPPLAVAILSTPSFDASSVDADSVCFGDPNNATQRDCSESHGHGHFEDVDGDSDIDLLLHFDLGESGFDEDDQLGCLTGQTQLGAAIYGCDGITVKNGTAEAELPNLVVSLVAQPSAASARDSVQWTATVENTGIGAITFAPGSTVLSFDVPGALSNVTAAGPAGYSCSSGGSGTQVCETTDPDTLDVGDVRTFTLDGVLPDAPGPVTVKGVVDPAGIVTELSEADNDAEAGALVQAPNLTTLLQASPVAVAPGDDVAWTATVHNDGPGAALFNSGAAVVRFNVPSGLSNISFNVPAGYACAAVASESYDCTATSTTTLPAGSDTVFRLDALAPTATGIAEVVAIADPSNVLAEGNEADNEAAAQTFVENPNLVISLTPNPEQPDAGAPVEWTANVTNVGPTRVRVPAGSSLLELTYTPDLAGASMTPASGYSCATTADRTFGCSALALDVLASGADRTFLFNATTPAAGGDIDVTATADPAGQVTEADETDNSVTRSTSIVVPLPNLSISIVANPDPVDALSSVTWTATVRNDSPVAVTIPSGTRLVRFTHPAGLLNLFADTPSGYSCFISAPQVVDCAASAATVIPAGATLDFTLGALAPKEPGNIQTTAAVDPLNVILESDETDNSATEGVTVQPPDFSIALNAAPDPVDALSSVTWTATITNDGPANARILNGTRVVRFEVPAGLLNLAVNAPGYSCFIAATNTVDCATTSTVNIGAGSTVQITLLGLAPRQPGNISVTATADPLDVVPEGDETDNSATEAVTVQPPDFSIALNAAPDPVDALSSVTWTATITNDGPANARLFANTRLLRFEVPAGLLNLAVNAPGYSCFIAATNTVDCATTSTVNIGAGSTVQITLLGLAPRQPGNISVTAIADPLGVVPEGDETDNSATEAVTVQPPDFSTALVAADESVAPGDSVSWTATITNDGPANARLFANTRLLRFEVPAGLLNLAVNAPGYSCFIAATNTVDCATGGTINIAAGSSVQITLSGTAPSTPGTLDVTATADPLDAIPEADETDNSDSATITVS